MVLRQWFDTHSVSSHYLNPSWLSVGHQTIQFSLCIFAKKSVLKGLFAMGSHVCLDLKLLTHWCQVTIYSVVVLGQHQFWKWLGTFKHQTITIFNADILLLNGTQEISLLETYIVMISILKSALESVVWKMLAIWFIPQAIEYSKSEGKYRIDDDTVISGFNKHLTTCKANVPTPLTSKTSGRHTCSVTYHFLADDIYAHSCDICHLCHQSSHIVLPGLILWVIWSLFDLIFMITYILFQIYHLTLDFFMNYTNAISEYLLLFHII